MIVGGRIVQGYYGAPVPFATVELWQQVRGHRAVLSGRARADAAGLVHITRYPRQAVWYTVKFRPTANFGTSSSPTVYVRVTR